MGSETETSEVRDLSLLKPNYMLLSLQRILVLTVILTGVILVVYYTPMPGINLFLLFYEVVCYR